MKKLVVVVAIMLTCFTLTKTCLAAGVITYDPKGDPFCGIAHGAVYQSVRDIKVDDLCFMGQWYKPVNSFNDLEGPDPIKWSCYSNPGTDREHWKIIECEAKRAPGVRFSVKYQSGNYHDLILTDSATGRQKVFPLLEQIDTYDLEFVKGDWDSGYVVLNRRIGCYVGEMSFSILMWSGERYHEKILKLSSTFHFWDPSQPPSEPVVSNEPIVTYDKPSVVLVGDNRILESRRTIKKKRILHPDASPSFETIYDKTDFVLWEIKKLGVHQIQAYRVETKYLEDVKK